MDEYDYLVSFYFELAFKGERIAFREISGISAEVSTEEVVCGGENRFKYRLPTVTSSQNLVLKRAYVPAISRLVVWCKNSVGGGLAAKVEATDISVNLLDMNKKVSMKWVFHKAYPVKYSFSDLKSQESELLIESIELAYTYFETT
jgi:phage tail-like protein